MLGVHESSGLRPVQCCVSCERARVHLVAHRKALGERGAVGDDDERGVAARVEVEQQRRDRVGRRRDRGCRSVRRRAPAADRESARARSRRAASRRQRARPGDGPGDRRGRPARAARARASDRCRRPCPAGDATSVGASTFSSTEHCGSSEWSWNTKPIARLRKAACSRSPSAKGSCPSMVTVPLDGASSAPRM